RDVVSQMAVMAGLVPAIHVLLAPRVHIKQKPIMRVLVLAARMRPRCENNLRLSHGRAWGMPGADAPAASHAK
ncbi:MAG TPA: hypothetical protein VM715_10790, partial [Candidatus Acidoferrum sp.]|nr:hypothetical protein [Candidatus Acidoferrum sp.]